MSLKEKCLECKELRGKLEEMRASIKNHGVRVASELHSDLLSILSGQSLDSLPVIKIFWQQQQKAMTYSNAHQMRWHPMMIRFCLSLAIKSPSAYNSFQNVLYLPSKRRLRDYKNVIRPQAGFSLQVMKQQRNSQEYRGTLSCYSMR